MKIYFLLILIFLVVGIASAQQTEYVRVFSDGVLSSERIVKNAAFSGDSVSETVQTLGDGNRIIRKTTSRLFRDNEGRYRREDMPKQLGLPGADIDMPESIFILDPVTGFRYVLSPKDHTVRKYVFSPRLNGEMEVKLKAELDRLKTYSVQAEKERATADQKQEPTPLFGQKLAEKGLVDAERARQLAIRKEDIEKVIQLNAGGNLAMAFPYAVSSKYETKTDTLGVQNIEGVEAEGTRTTTTIPAGAIGNERPIEIVYEKWYSKDLQMIVMSKHDDARIGEQTYRLTNIRRDEPSPSLFAPPADYKVLEGAQPRSAVTVKAATGLAPAKVVTYVRSTTTPSPAAKPARVEKPQN